MLKFDFTNLFVKHSMFLEKTKKKNSDFYLNFFFVHDKMILSILK